MERNSREVSCLDDGGEHAGEGTRSARQNHPKQLRIIEKSCTTALEFYRGHALKTVS